MERVSSHNICAARYIIPYAVNAANRAKDLIQRHASRLFGITTKSWKQLSNSVRDRGFFERRIALNKYPE